MNKFMMSLRRFMYGRNGIDQLNYAIIILGLILMILNTIFNTSIIIIINNILIIIYMYRSLSKDIVKRRKENNYYLKIVIQIKKIFKITKGNIKDKNHLYLICPYCSQSLRVKKGVGKIEITCPKCRRKFDRVS